MAAVITPAMIESGIAALKEFGDGNASRTVTLILLRMLGAADWGSEAMNMVLGSDEYDDILTRH